MIEIQNLQVRRSGRVILDVPELTVESGARLSIIGPNGAGKSTLLRVLAGLETDYSGRVHVSASIRERVYVHQSPWLFRGSVRSNLLYGVNARGVDRSLSAKQCEEWAELFGLSAVLDAASHTLSGGEARRVALARALMVQADLLLLDEPFSDLDERGVASLEAALEKVGAATVVTTSPHVADEEAAATCFRLVTDSA